MARSAAASLFLRELSFHFKRVQTANCYKSFRPVDEPGKTQQKNRGRTEINEEIDLDSFLSHK